MSLGVAFTKYSELNFMRNLGIGSLSSWPSSFFSIIMLLWGDAGLGNLPIAEFPPLLFWGEESKELGSEAEEEGSWEFEESC